MDLQTASTRKLGVERGNSGQPALSSQHSEIARGAVQRHQAIEMGSHPRGTWTSFYETNELPELHVPTFEEYIERFSTKIEVPRRSSMNENQEQSLKDAREVVENYSSDRVEQWNKEIDGWLIFDGLFSATLTAFNIQSYPLLQSASAINSFRAIPDGDASSFPSLTREHAVRLNALWFSSLVFSLASASIGIIVKQWLKEYSSGLYGNSAEVARRRQHRINNLLKWKVHRIIAILPVLILIALALFFAGLVVLLYALDSTVANIVTPLAATLLLFFATTTILPALCRTCCYHSPQSVAAYAIWRILISASSFVLYIVTGLVFAIIYLFTEAAGRWTTTSRSFDRRFEDTLNALYRLLEWAYGYSWFTPPPNWRFEECHLARARASDLDFNTTTTAFEATGDKRFLDAAEAYIPQCVDLNQAFFGPCGIIGPLKEGNGLPVPHPQDVQESLYSLVDQIIRGTLARAPKEKLGTEMAKCASAVKTSGYLTQECYKVPDKFLAPFAVLSMGHHVNTAASNVAWSLLYKQLSLREFNVRDRTTRQTVAVATVRRLRGIKEDPGWLARRIDRAASIGVDWELECIQQHLQVAWHMTERSEDHLSNTDEGVEDMLLFKHALRLVVAMINEVPWKSSRRLGGRVVDSDIYLRLLKVVVEIAEGRDEGFAKEINPPLVAALIEGFKRLTKVDEWESISTTDEDEMSCRDLLLQLRSLRASQ